METEQSNAWIRFKTSTASRRSAVAGLTSALLSALSLSLAGGDVEAKKKQKQRNRKKNRRKHSTAPPPPTPPTPITRADAACPGPGQGSVSTGNARRAQTFTAINSGQLVSTTMLVTKFGPAGDYIQRLAIVDASGVPTNAVLASALLPDGDVPNGQSTITFTFSNPATVVAGTRYALILTRPGADQFTMHGRTVDACGGTAFISANQVDPFQPSNAIDYVFSTFVRA